MVCARGVAVVGARVCKVIATIAIVEPGRHNKAGNVVPIEAVEPSVAVWRNARRISSFNGQIYLAMPGFGREIETDCSRCRCTRNLEPDKFIAAIQTIAYARDTNARRVGRDPRSK